MRRLVSARRFFCAKSRDPYTVLGVSRTAQQSDIRARYLALAKERHPDVASKEPVSHANQGPFALISAAYHTLSDPQRRAQVDLELDRINPEALAAEAAAAAVALCRAGRFPRALATLVNAMEAAPGVQAAPGVHAPLVEAASAVLQLCAFSGEPHYAACERVYAALLAWDRVDGVAVNAYFQLALRGGHMGAAMRAAKHAADHGLEQSTLMQSTVRQVRRYKKSLEDARGGAPGSGST
jgi:hypothetical protein